MKAHKLITGTEGVKTNNSYFLVPQPANLPAGSSERTIMFWYRKDITYGVNAFFGYGGMGYGALFEILSDYIASRLGVHGYVYETFPTPTPRIIARHVTYRIHTLNNHTYVSCFIDGHPMLDGAGGIALYSVGGILNTAATDIKIGTGLYYSSSAQPVYMQQIKFWNGILTQEQIRAEMYSDVPIHSDGIVAAWQLTATTCTDVSGNGNHGVLHGPALPVQAGIARNKLKFIKDNTLKYQGHL